MYCHCLFSGLIIMSVTIYLVEKKHRPVKSGDPGLCPTLLYTLCGVGGESRCLSEPVFSFVKKKKMGMIKPHKFVVRISQNCIVI